MLRFGSREPCRYDEGIAYLPTIPCPFSFGMRLPVVVDKLFYIAPDHNKGLLATGLALLLLNLPQAVNVVAENVLDLGLAKAPVVKHHVNPRGDGLVDLADTVGGEKKDAVVIFQHP